jgi:hypothetical protein
MPTARSLAGCDSSGKGGGALSAEVISPRREEFAPIINLEHVVFGKAGQLCRNMLSPPLPFQPKTPIYPPGGWRRTYRSPTGSGPEGSSPNEIGTGCPSSLPPSEQIPQKLKTFAIRICSSLLNWRASFSAKCFLLDGKRASILSHHDGNPRHHERSRLPRSRPQIPSAEFR